MARNFYKKDGSYYYSDNNQKISNVAELQEAARLGGKEVSVPTQTTPATTNTQVSGMPKDLSDKFFEAYGRIPNDNDLRNYNYNPTIFGQQVDTKLTQTRASRNNTINNANQTTQNQTQAQIDAQRLRALHDEIDAMNLSAGEKAVLHQIANDDSYTSGTKIPSGAELSQIISDAATNAASDINPYYRTLTAREIEDTKNQLADIRAGFEQYQKQEAVDYKTKLANTKQTLRAKGLTFSGTSRATLGEEGALESQGIEGSVPEQRRLDYEKNLYGVTSKIRNLGTEAERQLGSANLSDLNFGTYTTPYGNGSFYNPAGNVATGDLELQRLKAIEQSKWDRIRQSSPLYYQ